MCIHVYTVMNVHMCDYVITCYTYIVSVDPYVYIYIYMFDEVDVCMCDAWVCVTVS